VTSMAISVFEAHARGKPVAQVVPYHAPAATLAPGRLSAALVFEKDLISPLGAELWESAR
jgi:hypothetical protein